MTSMKLALLGCSFCHRAPRYSHSGFKPKEFIVEYDGMEIGNGYSAGAAIMLAAAYMEIL